MQDYSLGDVARILKVSPRRLRYWQRTQLVESFLSESDDTPPSAAHFAFSDLVSLRTILSLLDRGIPLQRIRRHLETLRDRLPELDDPAAALRLWDESSRRLAVRRDGRLEEVGGQLLLEFEDRGSSHGSIEDVREIAEIGPPSDSDGFDPEGLTSEAEFQAMSWFERGCELDASPSQWNRAIEAYEKALELMPAFADAHCNLGAVRYNQGKREEARAAFEACLALEPEHVEANFNLANVLEEQGEDQGALAHYRRALAVDPLYPDLHINLALLYEKLDRVAAAHDHWRRYLRIEPTGTWAEVATVRLESPPAPAPSSPSSLSLSSSQSSTQSSPLPQAPESKRPPS